MAAYHNVDKKVRVLALAPWYRADHLMTEITGLRKINFAIVEQRQQALERLNSIIQSVPFSIDAGHARRFDADHLYVCELLGDWARKLQQLKSALSYKERDLRTHGVPEPKLSDNKDASASDAQQAFWNATTAVYDQLSRGDCLWDRDSFERNFAMDWH